MTDLNGIWIRSAFEYLKMDFDDHVVSVYSCPLWATDPRIGSGWVEVESG